LIILIAALLTLGFCFLARDAEATEFLRLTVKARAELGRKSKGHWLARFLDKMLDCAPCVAAWASAPAIGLSYLVTILNEWPAAFLILLVIGPVCATGLLYGLTLLSPSQELARAAALLKRKLETKVEVKKSEPKDEGAHGC